MKMRAKLTTSSKLSLRRKYLWIAGGGIALTATVIFVTFFAVDFFGIEEESIAQSQDAKSSRYPFDIRDKNLTKVNFTVLPAKINSVFPEVRPYVTADGKSLFFCRRNHPDNFSKQKD